MKKQVFLCWIFFCPFIVLAQKTEFQSKLIGDRMAVFYPQNFDPLSNLPSFALLKEPTVMGDIPKTWTLNPHFFVRNNQSYASFVIEKGTNLYGGGESIGKLEKTGESVSLWNTDNFQYAIDKGKNLYQSHPWVLGVRKDGSAFGLLADNTWKQNLTLQDSICFASEGPAFRMIVIERDSPQAVLTALAELVGKMPLPPLWSLGYQQCRYSYIPDSRIRGLADTFRLKKIPCDVIWMDIDYMDKFKIFTFDAIKIPDPKALNTYLHNKGFKAVWMIDPGVKAEKGYSVYDTGSAQNLWVQNKDGKEFNGNVWPGKCAFPDFTMPETQKWWGGLYKDYMETGIDGVWNDMNEPSVFDGPGGTMPNDNLHRGGGTLPAGTHLRYHNVYGMLMIKASHEAIEKLNPTKRPFVLSRSGYLGSHRYGATWTGDNVGTTEMMKLSIPMSLNLGLSGQAFSGPDIGGFAENTSAELFGQWIALGAYYPFSRGHACAGTNNKEPWAFGAEIENVSRVSLSKRYQMLPYLYTCFYKTSQTGIPMMQPVFFNDLKDTSLRKEEQAFFLGTDLLIVPQWAEKTKLPKGIWQEINWAKEKLSEKYQVKTLLREGAILPIGQIIQNTSQYKLDSVSLYIALDKNGRANGQLYEDAGEAYNYKNGEFAYTEFIAKKNENKVRIKLNKTSGKWLAKKRLFKLIVVNNDKIIESNWLSSNDLSLDLK